jgi:prepilin-type N-terminal cleavage/methylation domain-containing protein
MALEQKVTKIRTFRGAFSLIELMVVIAIVAVLAAVAAPAYKKYIFSAKITTILPIVNEATNIARQYRDKNGSFPNDYTLLPNLPSSPTVNSVQVFNGDTWSNVCTSDPAAVGSVEVDFGSALDPSIGGMGIINQIYNIGGADVTLCQYYYFLVGGPVPGLDTDLISGCENMYTAGFVPTSTQAQANSFFAQACPNG